MDRALGPISNTIPLMCHTIRFDFGTAVILNVAVPNKNNEMDTSEVRHESESCQNRVTQQDLLYLATLRYRIQMSLMSNGMPSEIIIISDAIPFAISFDVAHDGYSV